MQIWNKIAGFFGTWEVVRLQQNEFPVSSIFPYDKLCIKMTNYFCETVESEVKNKVKTWFSLMIILAGHRIERAKYGKIVFLFNWELSWLVIHDHHSDSSYLLNKIILNFLPYSFYFKKPGIQILDPDYFSGCQLSITRS